MSMNRFNSSLTSSLPAGQEHVSEQFAGDGHKHTFDLREVPSWLHAMTARVSGPSHPMSTALVIGNLMFDTFAEGYDMLVDRGEKRIYLKRALPKGDLLLVEYPFFGPNQFPAGLANANAQAEPRNIPGWQPWDYQNWLDFASAMREDKPIEYALCVWLIHQEASHLAFQVGEWSEWYHYARKHCPRFDREQPRWRKQEATGG